MPKIQLLKTYVLKIVLPMLVAILFILVAAQATTVSAADVNAKQQSCTNGGFISTHTSPFSKTDKMCLGDVNEISSRFYQFAVTIPAGNTGVEVTAKNKSGKTNISFVQENPTLFVSNSGSYDGTGYRSENLNSCNSDDPENTVVITAKNNTGTSKDMSIDLCSYKTAETTVVNITAKELLGKGPSGLKKGSIEAKFTILRDVGDGAPADHTQRIGKPDKKYVSSIKLIGPTSREAKNGEGDWYTLSDGHLVIKDILDPGTYSIELVYNDAAQILDSGEGLDSWTSTAITFKFPDIPVVAGKTAWATSQDGVLYSARTGAITSLDNANDAPQEPEPCDIFGNWSLRWLVCPIFEAVAAVTSSLDSLIQSMLRYDVEMFQNGGLDKGWQTFRGFAITLLVVAALFMVISQALGFSFLDAYTIKKVLPRLLIAIIGIALSWQIMVFVVGFINDIGGWIGGIIEGAFGTVSSGTGNSDFWTNTGIVSNGIIAGAGTGLAVGIGAPAAIATFSVWGPLLLSILTTAALGLGIGLAVLGIRLAVITMCIIIAPLAIAAWVLPGTKKLWDFWQNTFMTALLMFPIVMGFIALGKGMAHVLAGSDFAFSVPIAVLLYVAPYFMLPFAFKLAGGLMKTIFSIADDKSKGVFDKQRKFRSDRKEAIHADQVAGKRGNGLMTQFRQRSAAARHGGRAWGGEYQAHRDFQQHQLANKAVQDDGSWAGGDDDGSEIAVDPNVTNRKEYIASYASKNLSKFANRAEAEHAAEKAADRLEASTGAQIGSKLMQSFAFKARATSNTAYKAGDYEQMVSEARALVNAGVMSSSDAAGAFKANRGRADINGMGFNDWINAIDGKTEDGTGAKVDILRNPAESASARQALRKAALEGARPGDLVGGHSNGVKGLADQMVLDLQEAYASGDQHKISRELAVIAGRYDAMAQSNPQNARILADRVMAQQVSGATMMVTTPGVGSGPATTALTAVPNVTIQQLVEGARSDQGFVEMRREYQNRTAADMAGSAPTPTAAPED